MYCFCLSCILFVLVSLLLIFLRKNVSICSVYSCDFVCMDLHFKKKNSPLTSNYLIKKMRSVEWALYQQEG